MNWHEELKDYPGGSQLHLEEAYRQLDDFRHDHPLIWSLMTVTTNAMGSNTLAKRLGYPYHTVLDALRKYKREGVVSDREKNGFSTSKTLVWEITDDAWINGYGLVMDLKHFWLERRRQVDLDLARRSR